MCLACAELDTTDSTGASTSAARKKSLAAGIASAGANSNEGSPMPGTLRVVVLGASDLHTVDKNGMLRM